MAKRSARWRSTAPISPPSSAPDVAASRPPPRPPAALAGRAAALPLLRGSGRFGISILGHAHQRLADRFSGRDGSHGADRFTDAQWLEAPGHAPVLADALASFECEVEEVIERFSHAIVIGRVNLSRVAGGDGALVYWRAAYGTLIAGKP